MILSGTAIASAIRKNEIVFEPFVTQRLNPNSIDVCLGERLLRYTDDIIDPASPAAFEYVDIPADGIVLDPGEFVLGATAERVGSCKFVPIVHGKSGIARAGLFAHVTADLIDIGSVGNLTLQLLASIPIKLYAGMPIAQVSFWVPRGDVKLYEGKYQGSVGPQPSRIYLDPFFSNRSIG